MGELSSCVKWLAGNTLFWYLVLNGQYIYLVFFWFINFDVLNFVYLFYLSH